VADLTELLCLLLILYHKIDLLGRKSRSVYFVNLFTL